MSRVLRSAGGLSRRGFLERVAATGVVAGSGGLLAACGGDDGEDSIAAGTITFIKGPNFEDDLKFQKELGRRFNASHPKITVQARLYDWANVETQLTTAFASPNPPDVVYMADTLWPKFAAAGALKDITDEVNEGSFKSTYGAVPDQYWTNLQYEGRNYGVPWTAFAAGLLSVNLDLMEMAGVTDWNSSMEALREAARKTTGGKVWGFGMPSAHVDFAYQDWLVYVHNAGADIFNEDGTGGGLDVPGVAEAFQVLREIQFDDESSPRAGLYNQIALTDLFAAGRLAILDHDAPVVGDYPDKIKFDWDVFLPPPGTEKQTAMGALGSLFISEKSKAPGAAWEYIKHLASPSTTVKFCQAAGAPAAQTGLGDKIFPTGASDPAINPTRLKMYEEIGPEIQATQPHPKQIDGIRAVSEHYEALVRGKLTGAEFAEKANAAADTVAQGA
jgi:ABC-type glycerol-3-phosphate transport system substrate-binding protein